MRVILGVFLILHGVAHLVGFIVPWKLIKVEESPYRTTLVSGRWDVGDVGIRVVGILWLVGAAAFMAVGVARLSDAGWWKTATLYVAVGSLILSVLGWPESRIGVAINILLLAYLFFGDSLGILPV
jgi:hypothetical protein